MSIRRRAAAFGAVSLGLVALAACDKPTPLATVTVGQKTVTTEAAKDCYPGGNKTLSATAFSNCLKGVPTTSITVNAGDKVRIGVDPVIAAKGWLAATNMTPRTELLKNETYWSLGDNNPSDSVFVDSSTGASAKSVVLNIVESDGGQSYLGVWQIKLVKSAS
jgi:hypothetical protein